MDEQSFYRFCISACLFMIFISLSINFVNALGVFDYTAPEGIHGNTTGGVTANITGQTSTFLEIFTGNIGTLLATAGALLGLTLIGAYSVLSGNWNIMAVYLFTVIFWGSWANCLFIFNIGGFYMIPAVAAIILMVTVGMFFLFVGATVGLLHLGEG